MVARLDPAFPTSKNLPRPEAEMLVLIRLVRDALSTGEEIECCGAHFFVTMQHGSADCEA